MESSVDTNPTPITNFYYSSSTSSPPSILTPTSTPRPPNIVSPCAACKILRRRCVDKCVLAPYFHPTEPLKFMTAHRVFGASNIIKFLQDIPEGQRADAVSSMVYEAGARIRDPVYGCTGAICQLKKQVDELQAELARAQAEMINMQTQNANLVAIICMDKANSSSCQPTPLSNYGTIDQSGPTIGFVNHETESFFIDDSFCQEPLWC